jgi:hypothetical protein
MNSSEIEAKLGELRTSVRPILAYSQRELSDYTDHGPDHSERVERLLDAIICCCNLHDVESRIDLFDRYLLISAAWLHDLGNVLGRRAHNERTCTIIDKLTPAQIWGLPPDCVELVKWICYGHEDLDLGEIPADERVRLRYLTAVFRIGDAADMDSRRAPIGVYRIIGDKLSTESRRHWRSHQAVRDVTFRPSGDSILVTVTKARRAAFAVKNFTDRFESAKHVLEEFNFPYTRIRVVPQRTVPYRH